MTSQPNGAQQPPHDASGHADPLALLAMLAQQRGSDEALDTLNLICHTLTDRQSLPEIERVVRALQGMADAEAFTWHERVYLITAVLDVGISLRLVSGPPVQDGSNEASAIERRHEGLPRPTGLPDPVALEHERLQDEIDSITRRERAVGFSAVGETELAHQVLHEPFAFELQRGLGLEELTRERDIDARIDAEVDADIAKLSSIIERGSPDDVFLMLINAKGMLEAKLAWNAYRDSRGPDATLHDVEPLARKIQRAADNGTFTRDERHYLIGNLAERKAPLRARELPEFVWLEERLARLCANHVIDPDDDWDFILAPKEYRELCRAREAKLMSIEAEWLESLGETEMARLLVDDANEYLRRQERGWTALFGVTRSEWEAAQEEKRERGMGEEG